MCKETTLYLLLPPFLFSFFNQMNCSAALLNPPKKVMSVLLSAGQRFEMLAQIK